MTIYSDKYHKKSKEEIEENDPVVIGDEYNDDNDYEESAYEVREDRPIEINRSIPPDERDGNREHLVAEPPDPNDDYYNRKKSSPIPGGLDTFRGTVRVTNSITKGGSGKVLDSYNERSSYNTSSSSGVTGRSKGAYAAKPVSYEGSTTGDSMDSYKKYIIDQKRRGIIK